MCCQRRSWRRSAAQQKKRRSASSSWSGHEGRRRRYNRVYLATVRYLGHELTASFAAAAGFTCSAATAGCIIMFSTTSLVPPCARTCDGQRIRLEKAQFYRQKAMVRAAAIGRNGQIAIHLVSVDDRGRAQQCKSRCHLEEALPVVVWVQRTGTGTSPPPRRACNRHVVVPVCVSCARFEPP